MKKNQYENNKLVKLMENYYKQLYISENTATLSDSQNFLHKLNLPTLSEGNRARLGEQIIQEEVLTAIKSLQGGKAPGPDGFGPDFYKVFQDQVAIPLLNMYLHSMYWEVQIHCTLRTYRSSIRRTNQLINVLPIAQLV